MCLRGASAVEKLLRADTTRLRALVVWAYFTPSDRHIGIPGTSVLLRVSDPRAVQYWDYGRLLSRTMVRDLPADTLPSVAQMNADAPVAWDFVALFRPGVRWLDRFPVPDWAGRPVVDVVDSLALHLSAIERSTPRGSAR
jgi:hypothetical protein